VVARHDYLPFGEEIPAGYAGRSASLLFGASDGVEQKFTGQIRDSETGMDFFPRRYYASAVGRFTSPDPMNLGADLLDPQSWNAYAYVRNNPLALVDPMGLCTFDAEGNAVEDENGACYEGGFGGSVTVVAQAPEEIPLIWVSFPSGSAADQNPLPTPPPRLTESSLGAVQPAKTGIKAKVCSVVPSGRTWGVWGGIGGVGSVGGGVELVINYNSGQTSAFAFGGLQLGWNGGVSGSTYTGFVYGLNSSNSNYSGGFTGINGGAGLGGFAASSSGGMTHGVSGLIPTGGIKAVGVALGAGLLGGFSGGVSASNYTNPLQLGKFVAFTPADYLVYALRQLCN